MVAPARASVIVGKDDDCACCAKPHHSRRAQFGAQRWHSQTIAVLLGSWHADIRWRLPLLVSVQLWIDPV